MSAVDNLLHDLARIRGVEVPKPKILVVDDNPDYARMLSEVLSNEGYDVVVASEPIQAMLDISSTLPFKRIFLDLNFPNSKETSAMVLRQIEKLMPKLPVTIVSGFLDGRDKEVADKAREMGLDVSVFSKVSGLDELLKIIKSDKPEPTK